MAAPDDLESRVTALEHQVRELDDRVRRSERDAAAARVLAGGADRDVGELRGEIRDFRQATTSSFNAMREDLADLRHDMADLRHNMADLRQHVDSGFAEMRREFARVDNGFAEVRGEFARVDNGFIEMRGRLDATAAGLQQIAGLITTLIEQGGQQNDQ